MSQQVCYSWSNLFSQIFHFKNKLVANILHIVVLNHFNRQKIYDGCSIFASIPFY